MEVGSTECRHIFLIHGMILFALTRHARLQLNPKSINPPSFHVYFLLPRLKVSYMYVMYVKINIAECLLSVRIKKKTARLSTSRIQITAKLLPHNFSSGTYNAIRSEQYRILSQE